MDGDVFGWYTLPCNVRGCQDFDGKVIAAADPDVYFRDYFRLIILARGIGTTGTNGRILFRTDDGWVLMSRASVDVGRYKLDKGTAAHEVGHNLGVHHASDYECGENVVEDNCNISWYGDWYDMMGCIPVGQYCG